MSIVRAEAEGAIVSSTELVVQMGIGIRYRDTVEYGHCIAESFRDNLQFIFEMLETERTLVFEKLLLSLCYPFNLSMYYSFSFCVQDFSFE